MKNYKFISSSDNLELDVLKIEPKSDIKGVIVIAHGMAEHKERYIGFMDFLANHNYVAIINDHRGHGASVKSKNDLGYFYDETGNYIVEDIHDLIMQAKKDYPNVSITLFGHSMGSLVVRKYIKKYDDTIDKLIVCGAPCDNPLKGVALSLTKLIKVFKGDHHRTNLINTIAFSGNDKKFSGTLTNRWLSKNEDNVKAYNANELDGYVFTTNGFINLFKLMIDTYSIEAWKVTKPDLPILFIAGSDDPCIGSKDLWLSAQDFLKKRGYLNIEGILYPEMRHEILQEDDKELVYNDILEFIDK